MNHTPVDAPEQFVRENANQMLVAGDLYISRDGFCRFRDEEGDEMPIPLKLFSRLCEAYARAVLAEAQQVPIAQLLARQGAGDCPLPDAPSDFLARLWRQLYGDDQTIEFTYREWLLMGAAVLAEAERAHRWIPVDERMPEPEVDVLVFVESKIYMRQLVFDGEGAGECKDKPCQHGNWWWCDRDGEVDMCCCYGDDGYSAVTHWKPLDEPPMEAADLLAGMRGDK